MTAIFDICMYRLNDSTTPPLFSISTKHLWQKGNSDPTTQKFTNMSFHKIKIRSNNISEHTFLHMLLGCSKNFQHPSHHQNYFSYRLWILGFYLHCPSQDMLVNSDMSHNFIHPQNLSVKGEADCSWQSPGTNQQKSFLPLRPGRCKDSTMTRSL